VGSPPLDRYAFLLLPRGDSLQGQILELGRRWGLEASDLQADVVICGRPPSRSMRPLVMALTTALFRGLFIARLKLRSPAGYKLRAVHYLAPPPGPSGKTARFLRDGLLRGAVVELIKGAPPMTLLDGVAHAAGAALRTETFHAPGDGSAVARLRMSDGSESILRAARAGEPADPARIADGLTMLERAGVALVPGVTGRGVVDGISWMTESMLRGSEPARVDARLQAQIVDFCATLPTAKGAPLAPIDDFAIAAAAFPSLRSHIEELAEAVAPIVARLPSVLRHGDLWSGNLLVERGSLVGVIDWAAWHPSGVPGTDLFHLLASERKRASGAELGRVWLERFWTADPVVALTSGYWRSLGVDPAPEVLDAVGACWWAVWVAQSVTRHPARASQPEWVAGNVDCVVDALSRVRS
jgi:Phosphotransferase enzyme family